MSAVFMAGARCPDHEHRHRPRTAARLCACDNGVVRPEPDDHVLWRQRHERGAVPVLHVMGGAPAHHMDGRRRRPPPGDRGRHRDGPGLLDAIRRCGLCRRRADVLVGLTTYRARRVRRRGSAVRCWTWCWSAGPGSAAFVGWAATSWLITGVAFAQFSSQYGNTAILEQSGLTATGLRRRATSSQPTCIMLLAPTLLLLALWAGIVGCGARLAGADCAGGDLRRSTDVSGCQLCHRVDVPVPALLHCRDPVCGLPGDARGARAPCAAPAKRRGKYAPTRPPASMRRHRAGRGRRTCR